MLDMLNDKLCSAKPTKPVKKRGDGGGLYLLVKVREEAVSRVWQFAPEPAQGPQEAQCSGQLCCASISTSFAAIRDVPTNWRKPV
jgi:hypothetical protein